MWPALSKVRISWAAPAVGLSFVRQPLSVRKVRGTCTFHPSASFFPDIIWDEKGGIGAGKTRDMSWAFTRCGHNTRIQDRSILGWYGGHCW